MGVPQIVISAEDLEKGPLTEKHGRPQDGAGSTLPNAYYDIVGLKLQRRPWLECLHQFMNPATEGFAVQSFRRMNDFDIKVIHIKESGNPDPAIKCSCPEEFKQSVSEENERIGTLIIAKGLSRSMIEVLGTTYELEPEFFASYLAGTEMFRQGHYESPLVRLPARSPYLLPDYIRKSPFYTAEYRRPYHIEGGFQMVCKLRVKVTNITRGVSNVHHNLPDVFVGEKISVYKKTGSKIGIILTDQLLSDVPPASHIPNPVSLLDDGCENFDTDTYRQISARRELISWIQHLTPDETKALFNDHAQLFLQPVLKIVERHSVMFLLHVRYIMNRVLIRNCDAQFPNSIPFFLSISRSLHRFIHQHQRLLCNSLAIASLRGGDDISEQKEDFAFLDGQLSKALNALEEDVKFLVGEASVREGKIVGWVSKFAALFLPVSLLATILSISDPGYVKWAILGGLSVPFVLISIYLMFMFPTYFDGLDS
ncbi:hypothetical protein N431DRAFT_495528 [Stipitochalara longipes BDJ]|nr:hypothetical protein N431DRAFT_495528 [Stipitochalara longipes BDJ]